MADHFGTITLKWDPKNLEIRTMSVEKTLEPLVLQVIIYLNLSSNYFLLIRNELIKRLF